VAALKNFHDKYQVKMGKKRKYEFQDNPGFIQAKLYSIAELSAFGISQNELRNWYEAGILKPSTYSGSSPKFKMKDFESAQRLRKSEYEAEQKLKQKIKPKETNDFGIFRPNSEIDYSKIEREVGIQEGL
jgi:hypothetical protein